MYIYIKNKLIYNKNILKYIKIITYIFKKNKLKTKYQ